MADVKIVDIDNEQWNMKDQEARNRIANLETSISNDNTYSTEEVKTSKIWINRKPIYRKIIFGKITETIQNINHQIINIDSYVKLEPYMVTDNQLFPSFNTGNYYFTVFATSKTGLILQTIQGYINNNYRIILEYTKTTD